jgi:hypothetical protein
MKLAVQLLAITVLVAACDACKCAVVPVPRRYYSPEYERVVRAVVTNELRAPCMVNSTGCPVIYKLRVAKAFKGCDKPAMVDADTTSNSASCGIKLNVGAEYLMFLKTTQTQRVTSCQGIQLFSELSASDRVFLNTRRVCCGSRCKCVQPYPTSSCFVEPCKFAKPPCTEAVRCSGVCGECRAEWFTKDGYPACLPSQS